MKRDWKTCPTCNGWVWNENLQKWFFRRETKGMICQTCGHDYSESNREEIKR